jgi:hypothetical protein
MPASCGKSDSLYSHIFENILSCREAAGGFDVVVMPAKEKVRAEVKVLLLLWLAMFDG